MDNVVLLGAYHPKGMELIASRPDLFTFTQETDTSPEAIAKAVTGADAIVVRTQLLPREILALAPKLKIVSRHGVGTDNIDVAYLSERKIPMALAVDSNMVSVAEHTMMMILALAKDALRCHNETRAGNYEWRDRRTAMDIAETTVLIMGFGRIGRRVAELCLAFGMKVLAYDPYIAESPVPGVTMVQDFRSCLGTVDFLSMHLPSTPETRAMFGAKELGMLKQGAIIVNCARGGVIDEELLCDALESGHLGGVGLDVFAKEPPVVTDRLFRQEKVIFSPHNAALTDACAMRMSTQAIQNVIDCLDGKLQPRVVQNRREIGL